MAYFHKEEPDAEKILAYDLRQTYAEIVGDHVKDVSEARKSDNFYVWFKNMEDLHTVVKFKFKEGDDDEKDYQKARTKVVNLANKYKVAWSDKNADANQRQQLDLALREMEDLLYLKMDEASLFGSITKEDDEGL